MNEKCIDIGTIQAFLDGELLSDSAVLVSEHATECDNCAVLLADAENENSAAFAVLEREFDVLVPTQRLWSRINESIEIEKSQTPFWQKLYAFVSLNLTSPSLSAAAGVLVIFGMAAVIWNLRSGEPVPLDLAAAPAVEESALPAKASTEPDTRPAPVPDNTNSTAPQTVHVNVSNHSPEQLKRMVVNANLPSRRAQPKAEYLNYQYLPGEESYIKTIADLKQNIDERKDALLPPSSRVAFERDLAVVNNAIDRMQQVVRKDPKNQAAKQVLYSSYQDKIDLLNSVAQREELMAGLR
jgi:anti-sigma factor RsiW